MRCITLCMVVLLALLARAEDGGKEQPVAWRDRAVPGPSVTLRFRRGTGKSLIYEGTLDRTQQGNNGYIEHSEFYLTALCVEQAEGLDKLAFRRTYLDRKRTEMLEKGKRIERALENTDDLVNLGPNFTLVNSLRCYAFDAQNRMAYKTEQLLALKDGRQLRGAVLTQDAQQIVFLTGDDKFELRPADVAELSTIPQPHVCIADSPHYMFPILSSRALSPGETWRFKVPAIIPVEQGTPPRLLPTQFNISVVGRLREVKQTGGRQTALVDYKISGAFDSADAEYRSRFPDKFHEMNRIVHKLEGTGAAVFDVEKGWLLEKSEDITVTLFASSVVPQAADKPMKREENKAEIQSSYRIKLLLPGTRLKNGKVIPQYE
jgi:hypothetical protein